MNRTVPRLTLAASLVLAGAVSDPIRAAQGVLTVQVSHVNGKVLWANLFLLFWLSLFPLVIRWIGEAGVVAMPVAAFGIVLAFR